MSEWNYEDNHVFKVEKGEVFGFKITENHNSSTNIESDDIYFEDGFLYGYINAPFSFQVYQNEESRTYYLELAEGDDISTFDDFFGTTTRTPSKFSGFSGGNY